jgi:hypothetical protein
MAVDNPGPPADVLVGAMISKIVAEAEGEGIV